jgi:hypothetical protein
MSGFGLLIALAMLALMRGGGVRRAAQAAEAD